MVSIIGVRFQQNGKMYYFDADNFTPVMGDYVIVSTERGIDLGEVVMGTRPVEDDRFKSSLGKMIRVATEQDIQKATENRTKEAEAFVICQKKIAEHKLEMKLVSVECSFDNSKILFYFTANGRVDFRALVKDLASVFKTRIELRQIGVRDEARMLGGLGPCGRPICCGTFLSDFQPVSIKMAKEQSLSLNPTKISGVCGRLMCCLKYEQDHYEQPRKKMPRMGKEVMTPDGPGTICELNVVKETVSVRITKGDSSEVKTFPMDQVSRPGAARSNEAPVAETEEDPGLPGEEDVLLEETELEDLSEDELRAITDEQETQQERRGRNRGNGRNREGQRNRPAKREGRPEEKKDSQRTGENGGREFKRERKPRDGRPGRENREGNPEKQRLGQPVRRENPERARKEAAPAAAPEKPEKPAKQSAGWADAVERAIQAVDEK